MVTVARYKVHRPECKAGSLPLNYPNPHNLGQLQLCKYLNILDGNSGKVQSPQA